MAPMKSLPPLLSAMLLAAPAMASVSLEFQLGGVEVPPGSIAVLVADRADDGFVPPSTVSGATLAAGETIGADDVIIAVFAPSELAEWGALEGFAAFAPEIRYEDLGVAEGQSLTLHVFPDRLAGEPIRSGEPFVSYRTADLGEITADNTMEFALPPDGGAHLLATLAPANGGTADLSMVDLAALPYEGGDGQLQDQLSPAAVHTYFFELAGAGFLDLSGTGGNGLRAELYGPDGALVAASGNAGAFSIFEDLPAGWHVLRIFREPGGAGDFDYTLAFSSEATVALDLAVGGNALTLIGRDVFDGLPGQTVTADFTQGQTGDRTCLPREPWWESGDPGAARQWRKSPLRHRLSRRLRKRDRRDRDGHLPLSRNEPDGRSPSPSASSFPPTKRN